MSDPNLSSSVSDLPSLSIRRPVLIVVLNLLIAIAGFAALSGLEVRELPAVVLVAVVMVVVMVMS